MTDHGFPPTAAGAGGDPTDRAHQNHAGDARPDPADGPATLVFLDGRVVTMADAGAVPAEVEALAVRGDLIVGVGHGAEIRRWIGPRTRVVDLRGRTLLPGFQDAHVHPIAAGLEQQRCDLRGAVGEPAWAGIVRDWADAHPDLPWILGDGWSWADAPDGTPDRAALDDVVADRPVLLLSGDGHGAWANSRALELAGIERGSPEPPDGRIERRPDGEPQGTLHEGAVGLVARLAPLPTPVELGRALLWAQAKLHSLGITAWQDAQVDDDELEAYLVAAGRGELTAWVVGALRWDPAAGPDQVDGLIERRRRGPVGRFAATSVKLFVDGVVENRTAAMLEPYLEPDGEPGDSRGLVHFGPGRLAAAVIALDAAGFQVHLHAIGDRAVRDGLDAIAAARMRNGPSDGRHHLSHLQVIHPADIDRFARVDAVATIQPLWACEDADQRGPTRALLGDERVGWQYPFASLLAAGARLAGGSDWSVSTANPLQEIAVAVTRVDPDQPDGPPFLPAERLDLATALAAFTSGAAHANHRDDVSGSLTPGRQADLAILDRDLFDRGAGRIDEARVVATFGGGEAVFEAPGLDG